MTISSFTLREVAGSMAEAFGSCDFAQDESEGWNLLRLCAFDLVRQIPKGWIQQVVGRLALSCA